MQPQILLAALATISTTSASLLQPRACAGNNCARAVTGTAKTNPDVTARRSDCAAFQTTTAYVLSTNPASTVSTVVALSTVPAYASACGDRAAYASACSCFGETAKTIQTSVPQVGQPEGGCIPGIYPSPIGDERVFECKVIVEAEGPQCTLPLVDGPVCRSASDCPTVSPDSANPMYLCFDGTCFNYALNRLCGGR